MWVALEPFLTPILGIALALGIVGILFASDKGRAKFTQYLANYVGGALDLAAFILTQVENTLEPVVQAFAAGISANGGKLKADIEDPLKVFAAAAFESLQKSLEAKTNIQPGEWSDIAGAAMGDAVAFGLGSFAVSAAFEAAFPEKLNTLNSLGPMLATLAGFEEVTKNVMGPLLGAGIATPARYDANSRFRSIFPSGAAALNLHARGLISDADLDTLVGFAGLTPAYVAAQTAGAYHGYSPRMLLRVIESNLFSQAEINDELTFSGMRPVSQARMLKAAPYLATATYRSQLHATIEKAYVAGILSDQDFTDQMDLAETDTDRDSITLYRARIEKRLALIKELESAYSTQFKGHLIDQATYLSLLQGLGLQPDRVNALMAVSEAQANAALERQLEAAERQLERQTTSDERKAALRNFKNGVIDAAGLSAALILTGLSSTQAAAWVDLAVLEQAGASRFLYGQLLSPSDAKLLSERVTAIGTQVTKGLLDLDDAARQLGDLNVDAPDANALLAKWAAAKAAANAHGVILSAITGKPPGL